MANSEKSARYRVSFTACALEPTRSAELIALYASLDDWDKVRERALLENLVQAGGEASAKRVTGELVGRLRCLSPSELILFAQVPARERAYLLWLAACRFYALLADFAVEVIYEKFCSGARFVKRDDFLIFYNRKAEWRPELDRLSISSRQKLVANAMRICREGGVLATNGEIIPFMASQTLTAASRALPGRERLFFPGL